ncbi:MAG: hypothetical protein ACK4SY_00670 [Pyrobaculum sp.]
MCKEFIKAGELLRVARVVASRGGSASFLVFRSIWRERAFDIIRAAELLEVIKKDGETYRIGPRGEEMLTFYHIDRIYLKASRGRVILKTVFGDTVIEPTPSFLMSIAEKLSFGRDVFKTYRALVTALENACMEARGMERWICLTRLGRL